MVSLLVSRFDVKLAPGEDGSKLLGKSRDTFTLRMEDLNLVLRSVRLLEYLAVRAIDL